MTRYYRRSEWGLDRFALSVVLLVLFVFVLVVGKWMVRDQGVAETGDVGGEPVPVEAARTPTTEPSTDEPSPSDASRGDPVEDIPPPPTSQPPPRFREPAPTPTSDSLLASALSEALGDAPESPEPPEPDVTSELTTPGAGGEPGFEGRIGRTAVLTPPSLGPEAGLEMIAKPTPKPAPKPKPKPAPKPPPPPAEPEDAGEPPESLSLFAPTGPEAGPDPVVRPPRRRGGGRTRRRRTVATLQADKLTSAAAAGMVALVHQLLDLGTPIDGRDAAGKTALQAALDAGHGRVVAVLLARGADPSELDVTRRRALTVTGF